MKISRETPRLGIGSRYFTSASTTRGRNRLDARVQLLAKQLSGSTNPGQESLFKKERYSYQSLSKEIQARGQPNKTLPYICRDSDAPGLTTNPKAQPFAYHKKSQLTAIALSNEIYIVSTKDKILKPNQLLPHRTRGATIHSIAFNESGDHLLVAFSKPNSTERILKLFEIKWENNSLSIDKEKGPKDIFGFARANETCPIATSASFFYFMSLNGHIHEIPLQTSFVDETQHRSIFSFSAPPTDVKLPIRTLEAIPPPETAHQIRPKFLVLDKNRNLFLLNLDRNQLQRVGDHQYSMIKRSPCGKYCAAFKPSGNGCAAEIHFWLLSTKPPKLSLTHSLETKSQQYSLLWKEGLIVLTGDQGTITLLGIRKNQRATTNCALEVFGHAEKQIAARPHLYRLTNSILQEEGACYRLLSANHNEVLEIMIYPFKDPLEKPEITKEDPFHSLQQIR